MSQISVIFWKELLQLSRDMKGRIAGFFLPAIVLPCMMAAVVSIVEKRKKSDAVSIIAVGSDQVTEKSYLLAAHRWFTSSRFATDFETELPIAIRRLALYDKSQPIKLPDQGIRTDVDTFVNWCRDAGRYWRASARNLPSRALAIESGDRELEEFLEIAVKGVGNIEFRPIQLPHQGLGDVTTDVKQLIATRAFDVFLSFDHGEAALDPSFEGAVDAKLFHDSTVARSIEGHRRIKNVLRLCSRPITDERLKSHHLEPAIAEPLRISTEINVGRKSLLKDGQEYASEELASLVSFCIFVLSMMGAFNIAIEMSAFEKEKKTLEPLLIAPVRRIDIALGKFSATATGAALGSIVTILCVWGLLTVLLPPGVLHSGTQVSLFWLIATMSLLVLPAVVIGAAVSLAVSFAAGNSRQAQHFSMIAIWIMMLPGSSVLFPGFTKPGILTSMIPFVSTNMLAKEILMGHFNALYYCVSLISSTVLAAGALMAVMYYAEQESILSEV